MRPPSPITQSTGAFFGLLLAVALWGTYTILFGAAVWAPRERGRSLVSPPFIAVIFIYLLNLGRTVEVIDDGYMAFLGDPLGSQDWQVSGSTCGIFLTSPVALRYNNHNVSVADRAAATYHNIVIIYSPVLADATLVWRLYIIWSRDWRVTIVPLILLLGSFIDGTLVVAYAGHGYGANHDGPLVALIESYYAIFVTLNAVVTGVIVGRLWIASRRAQEIGGGQGDPFTKVITALVESVSLYLVALIVYIVVYALDKYALITVLAALPIIAGIVPTLIILQLNLGFLQPADMTTDSSGTDTSIVFAGQARRRTYFDTVETGGATELRSRPAIAVDLTDETSSKV